MFAEIVRVALASPVSVENLEHLLLEAARYEAGRNLSIALANDKSNPSKIAALMEKYASLSEATELAEVVEEGVEVFAAVSVEKLVADTNVPGKRLKLHPKVLNDRLKGGLLPGHHVILFARPEVGKTATAVTMACGFLRQRAPGIYFGNEDPAADIIGRIVSNLSGMTEDEVNANPQEAQARAEDKGLGLLTFVAFAPGSPKIIEQYVKTYSPKWIVVDQVKNLHVPDENKVLQMEKAATAVRNIAKKYGVVAISITQAGDSADFKAILDMHDVDFSKTGIPGACDVMVGIGATRDMLLTDERMISLPKNKVGSIHDNFPVKLNRYLSKLGSI